MIFDSKNKIKLIFTAKNQNKINFCDYFLTNIAEGGSDPIHGQIFQPYEICDHVVKPCETINPDCLVTSITWRYSNLYPNTTRPFIGYLRVKKLLDGEEIDIVSNDVDDEMGEMREKTYTLNGIFIITRFQVSSKTVMMLRVCGSDSVVDFMKAIDYYSLWDLTGPARRLLKSHEQVSGSKSTLSSKRFSASEDCKYCETDPVQKTQSNETAESDDDTLP